MTFLNNRTKKQIGYCFIAVFVALAIIGFKATSLITLHIHILPDGRVVAHSHPLPGNQDDDSKHKHTPHEYVILNAVVHSYQADDLSSFGIQVAIKRLCTQVEDGQINPIVCLFFSSHTKRAPPLFSFS